MRPCREFTFLLSQKVRANTELSLFVFFRPQILQGSVFFVRKVDAAQTWQVVTFEMDLIYHCANFGSYLPEPGRAGWPHVRHDDIQRQY